MSSKEETIQIDETAWVHESALLFGNIFRVRKFDLAECRDARRNVSHKIGARTNIQDFVMIHVGDDPHNYRR